MKTILIAITLMLGMTLNAQEDIHTSFSTLAKWDKQENHWVWAKPVPQELIIRVEPGHLSIKSLDADFTLISEVTRPEDTDAIYLAVDGDGKACHVILSQYADENGLAYITLMYSHVFIQYTYKN